MKFILTLSCLASALTSPCWAGTIDYDCDTIANRFSVITERQTQPLVKVSGKLTAIALHRSKSFSPIANVAVESQDNQQLVTLRVGSKPVSKDDVKEGELYLGIATKIDGGELVQEVVGQSMMQTAIPFEITSIDDKQVRIRLGDLERIVPFAGGVAPVARVTCSTGEFLFSELDMIAD